MGNATNLQQNGQPNEQPAIIRTGRGLAIAGTGATLYRIMVSKANRSKNVARIMAFVIGATVLLMALGDSALDARSLSVAAAPRLMKNERVKIAVEGMHCTGCARGIKAMLKRTPGVITAEVSFERREASVEYDPSRTSPEKIVEAINKLGYKAKVKQEKET